MTAPASTTFTCWRGMGSSGRRRRYLPPAALLLAVAPLPLYDLNISARRTWGRGRDGAGQATRGAAYTSHRLRKREDGKPVPATPSGAAAYPVSHQAASRRRDASSPTGRQRVTGLDKHGGRAAYRAAALLRPATPRAATSKAAPLRALPRSALSPHRPPLYHYAASQNLLATKLRHPSWVSV